MSRRRQTQKAVTGWGQWFEELAARPDAELVRLDIAETNLKCAVYLEEPSQLITACLRKVDEWTLLVERFTEHVLPQFNAEPSAYHNSESRFRILAMTDFVQRHIGVEYNYAFADYEYDASNPKNLFIHGILTGFGGTCVTLPVLYCAIGRRLGYPIGLAETDSHVFCRWDDKSDHFCFEVTSNGCVFRTEDHYREWPTPIAPAVERENGYIRRMTPREELALFAGSRANCLLDNLLFDDAVESFYLAHQTVPKKLCLQDSWGLAFYSAQLWSMVSSLPDVRRDEPIACTIRHLASRLKGPDSEFFSQAAADNIIRILKSKKRREFEQHQAGSITQIVV